MIASLTGRLVRKSPSQAVVDVQGVGYELFIPLSTYCGLPEVAQVTTLHVQTCLRDDAIQLFGFLTEPEKAAFGLLTTVSGIGPKLALSLLSTFTIPDLASAVEGNDIDRLATVPGIGKKSASRLVLELKDKVERLYGVGGRSSPAASLPVTSVYEDATSALVNLGYKPADVKQVLSRLHLEQADLTDVIRATLKHLAKG
ncbi:MAG: Holliday junction branch migration protein RuvA [Nitrospiraceae bacterium]